MDKESKKVAIHWIAAFSIIVVGMIGLYLKIEYSGWVLGIGGVVAVNASQI